jgi:AraC-like DNA-binding protein
MAAEARQRADSKDAAADTRQRLELAVEHYLQACYEKKTAVRVDECAAELNYSRPYLSRLALDVLGRPIGDYLRQKQLAYAARLLRGTPLTNEEIAVCAGFGTKWTFYRAFRKAHRKTPNQYREGYEMRLDRESAAPQNADATHTAVRR